MAAGTIATTGSNNARPRSSPTRRSYAGSHVEKTGRLIVIITGGAGKHSAYIPTFGNTRAVTRALKRVNGELVGTVQELKRR